jgi:hypothetical protein
MNRKYFSYNLAAWDCISLVLLLFFLSAITPSICSAVDCTNPPRGFGGSWARAYESWCRNCGGSYNRNNQSCTPGPNWGGGRQGLTPSYDYEQERQRQEAERLYRGEQERRRQRELEEQMKREGEDARKKQEEFEGSKEEALKSMKGFSEGEFGLKGLGAGSDFGLKGLGDTGTSGLGLKDIADAPTRPAVDSSSNDLRDTGSKPKSGAEASGVEPPTSETKRVVDAAKKHIPELEREVKGFQTLLKQFGASMRGNVAEFEKWQETFNEAADNSFKNAKEYGFSMLLQYNLMGGLEGSVKKEAFGKLDGLINSSDPKMRKWLGEQMKKRKIEVDRVKKVVVVGTQGGDLAALLSGDPLDAGKALDALLFVNDLLEATKVVSWAGSQYFQQAKMIGETYTDLAAFGFSCASVRKVDKATDTYNREIKYLSAKLQNSVKEMNCLKNCLDTYSERCFDRCTGKTRFGMPPPMPRQ